MEGKDYLYILRSESRGQFYVGSTGEPDRRLSQHNANANKATRNRGPWTRLALLQFPDLPAAKGAESWLKRMKSRRMLELVASNNFSWHAKFQLESVLESSTE